MQLHFLLMWTTTSLLKLNYYLFFSRKKVLPMCQCRLRCRERISLSDQHRINSEFWRLGFEERSIWMSKHAVPKKVARPRPGSTHKKAVTISYTLPDTAGNSLHVCKISFLHTLGKIDISLDHRLYVQLCSAVILYGSNIYIMFCINTDSRFKIKINSN